MGIKRYWSYRAAKKKHPKMVITNAPQGVNIKKIKHVMIAVCTHDSIVAWDCGCTYGCASCNIGSQCGDCTIADPRAPAGMIPARQALCITDAIYRLEERLKNLKGKI
jgi:hypothetical protein